MHCSIDSVVCVRLLGRGGKGGGDGDSDVDYEPAHLLATSIADKTGDDRVRLEWFDLDFGDLGALEASAQLFTVRCVVTNETGNVALTFPKSKQRLFSSQFYCIVAMVRPILGVSTGTTVFIRIISSVPSPLNGAHSKSRQECMGETVKHFWEE